MAEASVSRKPLWFVIALLATQLALVSSLVSKDRVINSFETEVAYMDGFYGEQATVGIVESASNLAQEYYVDSGLYETLLELFIPASYLSGTLPEHDAMYQLWVYADAVLTNIFIAVTFTIMRILSFQYWVPFMVLVGVPSLLTGYFLREIKKETFQYSSPLRFGVAQKTLYLCPLVLYLLIVMPFSFHPVIFVFLIVVIAVSISVGVANTIKRV